MTLNEFKAWLDGFDAAIKDAPTPDQWSLIKDKLKTVNVINMHSTPVYRSPSINELMPRTVTS